MGKAPYPTRNPSTSTKTLEYLRWMYGLSSKNASLAPLPPPGYNFTPRQRARAAQLNATYANRIALFFFPNAGVDLDNSFDIVLLSCCTKENYNKKKKKTPQNAKQISLLLFRSVPCGRPRRLYRRAEGPKAFERNPKCANTNRV